MNDNKMIARMVADEANKCCNRSDGYWDVIYGMCLVGMQIAEANERERCAKLCEKIIAERELCSVLAANVAYQQAVEDCVAAIRGKTK